MCATYAQDRRRAAVQGPHLRPCMRVLSTFAVELPNTSQPRSGWRCFGGCHKLVFPLLLTRAVVLRPPDATWARGLMTCDSTTGAAGAQQRCCSCDILHGSLGAIGRRKGQREFLEGDLVG